MSRPGPRAGPDPDGQARPGEADDGRGMDPEEQARQLCLRLLTGRPRTRAQLAEAMHRRGVPDDAAATVLARFTEVGLIDDAAFARAWVESRHHGRGLARRALSAELKQRGVDGEEISAAVSALDPADEIDDRAAAGGEGPRGQPRQAAADPRPAAGRVAGPEGLSGTDRLPRRP